MSYLNIPTPPIDCYVRGNFLRNQEDSHDLKFPCYIFGMASIPGRTPLFHFMMEDGGLWWRMPIHAFAWKKESIQQELDELVLWDSFSYYPSVTCFPLLKNKTMHFISRRKNSYQGRYLFTLDWAHQDDSIVDNSLSEDVSQHKCGHFIALDNGNFAIQPNNRLRLFDPSFTVKEELVIHRKYNTHLWTAERTGKWVTPDTDILEYDQTNVESGESNQRASDFYNQLDKQKMQSIKHEDKIQP